MRINGKIRAFALPGVMVVCVLMMLTILMAWSLVGLSLSLHRNYHLRKKLMEDLNSAIILYCRDSVACLPGDTVDVTYYDGAAKIRMTSGRWGLYEYVSVSPVNDVGDLCLTKLVGRKEECPEKAAFFLCDRNRALSLAGRSSISGLTYIPLNGINYTEMHGSYFSGDEVPQEMLRVAGKSLPELDSAAIDYVRNLRVEKTLDPDFREEIEIGGNINASDAIVVADRVRVRSGFKGSVQIFCTDSVTVESGAELLFPSGIFIDSDSGYPCVTLEPGSKVNGYVVVLNGDNYDLELRNPTCRQAQGSSVCGLVFVDGSCEISGCISGAAYVKDCFCSSEGYNYAGVLFDTVVERCDTIAYPVLLKGKYSRRVIKNIYQDVIH